MGCGTSRAVRTSDFDRRGQDDDENFEGTSITKRSPRREADTTAVPGDRAVKDNSSSDSSFSKLLRRRKTMNFYEKHDSEQLISPNQQTLVAGSVYQFIFESDLVEKVIVQCAFSHNLNGLNTYYLHKRDKNIFQGRVVVGKGVVILSAINHDGTQRMITKFNVDETSIDIQQKTIADFHSSALPMATLRNSILPVSHHFPWIDCQGDSHLDIELSVPESVDVTALLLCEKTNWQVEDHILIQRVWGKNRVKISLLFPEKGRFKLSISSKAANESKYRVTAFYQILNVSARKLRESMPTLCDSLKATVFSPLRGTLQTGGLTNFKIFAPDQKYSWHVETGGNYYSLTRHGDFWEGYLGISSDGARVVYTSVDQRDEYHYFAMFTACERIKSSEECDTKICKPARLDHGIRLISPLDTIIYPRTENHEVNVKLEIPAGITIIPSLVNRRGQSVEIDPQYSQSGRYHHIKVPLPSHERYDLYFWARGTENAKGERRDSDGDQTVAAGTTTSHAHQCLTLTIKSTVREMCS
eukprot:CAMPEP_0114978196 /NCGR_PEP_ID=MMETSP0216-20121206/3672_1 /TAXON_ID=223996 /ORGANISM="Protocruzia adherens, Strain Boccale" /LENGTH=527 /DNA_ID=CAMNT_0002339365 /DNA_START=123 /DNA_END=1706 /DNA_ORIENTATION=-